MRETVRTGAATILLIHGLSGSSRWWRPISDELGRDHRLLAVNLRGFGDARRLGRFDLASAADGLATEVDDARIGPVTVIGHSLGGLVAATLAADHPEVVRRLVLVGAPVVRFPWGVPRHALNLARVAASVAPRFVPVLAADAARAGPRTILSATTQLLRADITPRLGRIVAPTMLVWGSRDRLVPPALGRLAAERIPGSQYVEIPGAGHVPMWEAPGEFVSVVRAFLAAEQRP